mmetsp:Transcript_22313/g.35566  ORF Transcript_22313/g.35566 Transcript_22313/m.35566 type:complete len:286 (-) Transcript_22313:1486-2343(-)
MIAMAVKSAIKNAPVGQVHAIQLSILYPPHGKAFGDIVPHEIDHDGPRNDGQRPRRGQQAQFVARRRRRLGHLGGNRLGLHRRQCLGQQQLNPREHEAEEGRDPHPRLDRRQEDRDEKAREGIAVHIGRLVQFFRHAAHEPFEDPDRQRDVKEAMRQRHRQMRVKKAHRRIKLKERQGEHRRRGHSIGQQPEEQRLVAKEPVAREGVGRRQRHTDRNDRVQRHVDDRVEIAPIPAWVGKDHPVILQRKGLRKQAEARQDLVRGPETHGHQPIDRQHQKQDVDDRD